MKTCYQEVDDMIQKSIHRDSYNKAYLKLFNIHVGNYSAKVLGKKWQESRKSLVDKMKDLGTEIADNAKIMIDIENIYIVELNK